MPSSSSLNAMASDDSAIPYEGRKASLRKPMRANASGEAFERLGADGLCAAAGDAPAGEVEPLELDGLDALDAQGVREVRRVGDVAALCRVNA